MEELSIVLSCILGFCLLFYSLVSYFRPNSKWKIIPNAKRILLVTSHPDDETMFFGPTIVNISRHSDVQIHLLCLSQGDYRNQGKTRKIELYKACQELGILEENITLLKYTKLKDDPSTRWREELVSEIILQSVTSCDFDTIITFDRGGVSGHKNHTSVFNALVLLCIEKKLPKSTRVYCLRTVNIFRKYSTLLDLPMSFILSQTAYISSLKDWLTIQRAMRKHQSQYVWFRKLYMFFSRYVLINTFEQMGIPD